MKSFFSVFVVVIVQFCAGVNGYSSAYGSWDGTWVGPGVNTAECFAICPNPAGNRAWTWFQQSSTSFSSDRIETVYSGTTLQLTYSEPEDGGTTVNTESWTYTSSSDSISGINLWSWDAPGESEENGQSNFAGTRTYSCEKFARSITYTARWESSDDPGNFIYETFRIDVPANDYVPISWSDGTTTFAVWNECTRELSFETTETEDVGGTTTTNEVWQLDANGRDWSSVSSLWTYTGNGGSWPASSGSNSVVIQQGTSCCSSSSSSSLSTGAVVAIIICVLVALGLTAALCMYCSNKSKMTSGRPKSVKYSYDSEQQLPTVHTVAPAYNTEPGIPVAMAVG